VSASVTIHELSPAAAAIVRAFDAGLQGPDRAVRLVRLAAVLQQQGMRADAARLCLHVLEQAPEDGRAGALARWVLGKGVPPWHIPMLHDHVRAEAYARRLERAVRPGMLVLDIGTGSGLLAMLAARAGAELVVACEQDPAVAMLAAENVRRNGYADRVRVIARHSRDLVVGEELPRRADLLVSEIVDNQVLGEGVLDTVAYARAHLLEADAAAIPATGAIHVALGDADLGCHSAIDTVAGLDLSAHNALRRARVRVRRESCTPATPAATLFRFDLTGRPVADSERASCTLHADHAARVTCILQWMSLDLGEGIELSSGPSSPSTAWTVMGYSLPSPVDLQAGDAMVVHGERSRRVLTLWSAPGVI
jgi:type III protein arginine methyltransferase